MTFRHLRISVIVCETRSVMAAASQLFIAQPSISLAISETEDYYGVELFDRISRKLYLTENGRRALRYTGHIIDLLDKVEQGVRDMDAMGRLKVGTSTTIGTYLLSGYIRKLKQRYPVLRIEASTASPGATEQQILDNDIDVGIIEGVAHSPFIFNESSAGDRLVSIHPAGHESAGKTLGELSEARNQDSILREKRSAGEEILDSILAAQELNVHPIQQSANNQVILQGVKVGPGTSIPPYFLVCQDIREGELTEFRIKGPALNREYSAIYYRNEFLPRGARTLMELRKEGSGANRP